MGRWHTHYAQLLGAEVAAVVDGSSQAAASLARRTRKAAVFDDMGTMLATIRPDVVHVCTPLASHLPLALQAIGARAHALVEKPLTPMASQAGELLESAREKSLHVCPVHQFAFQRGVARAARALEHLGEPLDVSFTICSAGGGAQTGAALDAIVAEILPHPLSVLQVLWPGNPLRSDDWSAQSPRHGELNVQGRSGEIPVGVRVSMNARPTRCEMEVLCRDGSIHLNFFHGSAVIRQGVPSRLDKIAQPFRFAAKTVGVAAATLAGRALRRELAYPGLGTLIERFYAAARGSRDNPISAEDALAVALVREHVIRLAIPGVLHESGAGRECGA